MVFNQQDWEQRLKQAKTQEEFTALVMELPEGSTPADDPASSITEPPRPSTPLILNTRRGKIQVG